MAELSRGANAPLTTGPVTVSVSGISPGAVDLLVFQVGELGKVRSDADFVFFNQPESPEGAVRVTDGQVFADLTRVPMAIVRLVVAVSMDDGTPGNLAGISGLSATVAGQGETHTAAASGLTTERAAILVEIYRRADAWKVRNVSAGWNAGLSALAAEHGVEVDDPVPAAPPVQGSPLDSPSGPSGPSSFGAPQPHPPAPGSGNPDDLQPPVRPGDQPAAPFGAAAPLGAPGSSAVRPEGSGVAPPPGMPIPGGFAPPGGSLPPRPASPIPQVGGFPPPGGELRR